MSTEGERYSPKNSRIATILQSVNELLIESRSKLQGWEFSRSGWRSLEDGLRESYAIGCKTLATIETSAPRDAGLHKLRKRVKDHWYHMRLLEGLWPTVMDARINEINALTDLLGDGHDLVVVRQALETRRDTKQQIIDFKGYLQRF